MSSALPAFKGGQLAVIEQVGAYLLIGIHLHVTVEFGCMAHIPEGVRVANSSGVGHPNKSHQANTPKSRFILTNASNCSVFIRKEFLPL